MDSDSKRQKSSEEEEEEDRISNLPASLISHILSLLPTKYAVRTSTLSTFWNQQWTSITQLRFDDALAPDTSSTTETKASFVNFVYRVLLHLQVASLDVFQLNCTQDYRVTHINSWVSAALSRHIQHIDISVPTDESGLLPRSFFTSRNLVVLKLGTGFLLKVPTLISLDSLKILHLAVMFSDNDSLSRLVSSCPVLEELKMQGSIGNNVTRVNISSTALNRLILIGLDPRSEPQLNYFKIVLNTPGLQYFEHIDFRFPDSYSIETLHCLDRARIDLALQFGKWGTMQKKRFRWAQLESTKASLFVGISNAKSLYLSKDTCQALDCLQCGLPKFPFLIKLELCKTRWGLLKSFLESSPQLATLSFCYPDGPYEHNDRPLYLLPQRVPYCMVSNLKKIEVKDFDGQRMELDTVRYFLNKSKCLKKLFISYPS